MKDIMSEHEKALIRLANQYLAELEKIHSLVNNDLLEFSKNYRRRTSLRDAYYKLIGLTGLAKESDNGLSKQCIETLTEVEAMSAGAEELVNDSPGRMMDIMEDHWIDYPDATQALDTLVSLLREDSGIGAPTIIFHGQEGQGKTTLLEKFKVDHGQAFLDSEMNAINPVVIATAPPAGYASLRNLRLCILLHATGQQHDRLPDDDLFCRLDNTLSRQKVSVLVLDDAHNLMNQEFSMSCCIMEEIGRLKKVHGLTVVMSGDDSLKQSVPCAWNSLPWAPTYPEMVFKELPLKPWIADSCFRGFLDLLEKRLDLDSPADLSIDCNVDLLLEYTSGDTRSIVRGIQYCAKDCMDNIDTYGCISPHNIGEYLYTYQYPDPKAEPSETLSPQREEECRNSGFDASQHFVASDDPKYQICPLEKGSLEALAWKESFDIGVMDALNNKPDLSLKSPITLG